MDGDGEGDAGNPVFACVLPENASINATDCDDSDADLNNADVDGDGLVTCIVDGARDCDDMNDTIGATDEDMDGSIACIDDCDDMDASLNNNDGDMDGVSTCSGDCDDEDAGVGIVDEDGDGFSACYQDCWDSADDLDGDGVADSANVYRGAASMEADLCTVDADGDGYGDNNIFTTYGLETCMQFDLYDTGSFWDNAAVTITDSTGSVVEITNEGGGTESYEVCASGAITVEYNCTSTYDCANQNVAIMADTDGDGVYETEVYSDGDLVTGNAPMNGVIFNGGLGLEAGSDCDDTDAAFTGDNDGDGYFSCIDDCDDTDAAVNPSVDADGDGFNMCLDCDEMDNTINPDAEEVYYDGIDSNCDGMNDFDMDMDGDTSMEHDGSCSDAAYITMTDCETAGEVWTAIGLDCDDDDDEIRTLANEADPTACYEDADGDGWGDDSPSTWNDVGQIAGTDCSDSNELIYPGAAYNELDVDGDGVTDCTYDDDGDGWGANDPNSFEDWMAGTDCDDTDAGLYPGLDADGDGFELCPDANGLVDCDDNDGTTYPGAGFNEPSFDAMDYSTYECVTDGDGDGYALAENMACYVFDLADDFGDGWNLGMSVEVYADSAYIDEATVSSGYSEMSIICVDDGATVEFVFNAGSWASEAYGTIYYGDLVTVAGVLTGSGSTTMGYDDGNGNVDYADGDVMFTETAVGDTLVGGSDPDDTDANVTP
jgi:hypothetical protein